MSKMKFGLISLFLGLAMLGLSLANADPSVLGIFSSMMLILMAVWDFVDHYARKEAEAEQAKWKEREATIRKELK